MTLLAASERIELELRRCADVCRANGFVETCDVLRQLAEGMISDEKTDGSILAKMGRRIKAIADGTG